MQRRLVIGLLAVLLEIACTEKLEPPGAESRPAHVAVVTARAEAAAGEVAASDAPTSGTLAQGEAGTVEDNLPFVADGTKVGSIAWRTWIYTDTGPNRRRYGYLRAGALVDARGPAIINDGCVGGWYRINPRGFVCVGKGATLDVNHEVLRQAVVRPARGQGLPYVYTLSTKNPPYLYFKLPSVREMRDAEGDGISRNVAVWRHRIESSPMSFLVRDPAAPPEFLQGGASLSKPYGLPQPLRYAVHAGLAPVEAGFALQGTFEWQARVFGLTTEQDIIALDRTSLVEASAFHGVALTEPLDDLPVAFTKARYAQEWTARGDGQLSPLSTLTHRAGIKLSGKTLPGGFHETRTGSWVVESALEIIRRRTSWPSVAIGSRKWLDISIRHQTLVAYEGRHAVYATLISSGRGGTGDPETESATIRGTFMIHTKHVSSTMDGDEDKSDSFNLHDVPFVQYFHKGFALHGTYWHDDFGRMRSHGCINLAPQDAAWLFEWTDPGVPEDWHGALNLDRGTVVYIHI